MALLKKNDDVVKEIAKKEKQKQKQSKGEQSKALKAKGVLLGAWLYQPIVALVAIFALVFVLTELLFVQPQGKAQLVEDKALALSVVRSSIERFVSERERSVQALAKSSVAAQALRDSTQGTALESLYREAFPDLQSLHFISIEELAGIRLNFPELSFASVDLIRRAVSGEAKGMEAFASANTWSLQMALPFAPELVGEGVILATFDLSQLKRSVLMPTGRLTGKAVLKPDFADDAKAIMQWGSSVDASEVLSAKVKGGRWKVLFELDLAQRQGIDRTMLWLSLGAGLVLSALLVWFFARLFTNKVRTDIAKAGLSLRHIFDGEGKRRETLYFAEANAMLSSAKEAAQSAKPVVAKAQPEQSAPQAELVVEESGADNDAPMFDDDFLDLVGLDDSEQSADFNSLITGGDEQHMVQEVEQLDLDVPQSIFRAYDIRGVVDDTLNEQVVELIGRAFASQALSQGQTRVCVGYDGRLSSVAYCEALTRGIVSTGADAIVVGQVPTPVLYFATHQLETGTGVMITGSHNPSNYNGFKMMIAGSTLANDDIQQLYNRIILQDFEQGQGQRSEQDVSRAYLDTIVDDIAVAAPLKVVVDAGNGVAGELGPALIEELGCEVIPLFCEIDGTFPNHHPDPGKPKNLQDLIAAVQEHNADIGLAFDGDGDRVGVVTNTGKIIWPDRLLMLFAKDVVSRNPGADVIFDVKCSRRLNGLISGYGGRPVMWKTGHSLIKSKMKESGALLAGEMSGHIFFKERWFGFDDGLYSAARLLEILGVEEQSAEEVFEAFPEDVSTPEINIDVTDESKFIIVEKLCQLKGNFVDGNVSTIDGLRVDYPNGWGLCRASNTTPVLVLRFEADDDMALEEIKQKFKAQLAVVEPSLNLDF